MVVVGSVAVLKSLILRAQQRNKFLADFFRIGMYHHDLSLVTRYGFRVGFDVCESVEERFVVCSGEFRRAVPENYRVTCVGGRVCEGVSGASKKLACLSPF